MADWKSARRFPSRSSAFIKQDSGRALSGGCQTQDKTNEIEEGFRPATNTAEMFRAGLYARVSMHDQKTLPLKVRAMREYAAKRGWEILVQIREVDSGVVGRELREKLMAAARRRDIDVVLCGGSNAWAFSRRPVVTLKELTDLGVGFVSLTEALDLTTPIGRAMPGLLSLFAEFRTKSFANASAPGLSKPDERERDWVGHSRRRRKLHRSEASSCRRQQSPALPRHRSHLGVSNLADYSWEK